ncbi:MAG TPA: hypothetical protein VEK57_15450 [Thermoanaerobaculia bacterium]|nr:hypothetical protein [Thermoanaerobaculia bacterium]
MSTKETVVSTVVSKTDPIPAATPLTSHTEGAQARRQDLRQMWELIPRRVIPLSPADRIRLNSAASVPPEFIELTTVAVANERSLVRGEGATPDQIRDLTAYADAYAPFADELEAFALFVRHSVTAARHFAGTEALTTYSLAQRLAKQPATAHLAPRVADMRRALGRVRKLTAEEREQRAADKAAKAAAQTP